MTAADGNRAEFLSTVRSALGRLGQETPDAAPTGIRHPTPEAMTPGDLLDMLGRTAGEAGWSVCRAGSPEDAAGYVADIAGKYGADLVVTSAHPVLREVGVEAAVESAGAAYEVIAIGDASSDEEVDRQRQALRERALEAGMGVSAAEYAIAETGSCIMLPGPGVSRLVSLLPPVFVAIVEPDHVLPSLDDLFALLGQGLSDGSASRYAGIITGPSRSADIEQTVTVGVHGPGEVHMVLLDYLT